jgi:heat shock protein HslJ
LIKAFCALSLLALGACMMTEPKPEVPEGNWLLPGTSWKLVALNGTPFAARATATLTEDGRITGQAPCNAFNASYAGRWPDLRFDAVASTRMACPDLAAETAFFAALDKVDHAELLQDALLLTGPDKTVLRFVRG